MAEQEKNLDDSIEEVERRRERQEEWGQQFDKWLINQAKRNLIVEILLTCEYPGISKDGNIVHGIPKRVDKYYIQLIVDRLEVWINKDHIVGCKGERHPVKTNDE